MTFQQEPNRIFALAEDGKLIAEITFPPTEDGNVVIDHTFVDDSLRGQGIASQLAAAAVAEIQKTTAKATVTCPYVRKWFAQHPGHAHVLAQEK